MHVRAVQIKIVCLPRLQWRRINIYLGAQRDPRNVLLFFLKKEKKRKRAHKEIFQQCTEWKWTGVVVVVVC